jgi:hypothetical protein
MILEKAAAAAKVKLSVSLIRLPFLPSAVQWIKKGGAG